MEPAQARALRQLIESQQVAALATLHRDEPALSMVPYALLPQGRGFVIHVSRLATHTADMLAQPAVAMLFTGERAAGATPQETPRVSIRGIAAVLSPGEAGYDAARQAYLARFPTSEPMFEFADFSLMHIAVQSLRYVGGFAQAVTVMPPAYVALMSD
jgi:putative heme iron utilization protein